MNNRILFIAILLFVFSVSIRSQDKAADSLGCQELKLGKFEVFLNTKWSQQTFMAERILIDSILYEIRTSRYDQIRYKVTWISDCSYSLTFDKVLKMDETVTREQSEGPSKPTIIKIESIDRLDPTRIYAYSGFENGNKIRCIKR